MGIEGELFNLYVPCADRFDTACSKTHPSAHCEYIPDHRTTMPSAARHRQRKTPHHLRDAGLNCQV